MDYSLAKQLKDAGYPIMYDGTFGTPKPVMPTLSELIEACGEEFESLAQFESEASEEQPYWKEIHPEAIGMKWHAVSLGEEREIDDGYYTRCESGCCGDNGFGKTPEEAVARLWLELQK